jgi:hypothetical protein
MVVLGIRRSNTEKASHCLQCNSEMVQQCKRAGVLMISMQTALLQQGHIAGLRQVLLKATQCPVMSEKHEMCKISGLHLISS